MFFSSNRCPVERDFFKNISRLENLFRFSKCHGLSGVLSSYILCFLLRNEVFKQSCIGELLACLNNRPPPREIREHDSVYEEVSGLDDTQKSFQRCTQKIIQ